MASRSQRRAAAAHGDFEARIDELLAWEGCIDDMAVAAPLLQWTKRRLAESVLVLAVSHLERFIEAIFVCHLAPDVAKAGRAWGLDLSGSVSAPVATALIAGDRYFDFKSFGELRSRARKLLIAHPFDRVGRADVKRFDEILAMRNHILHRSRKTLLQLRSHVPGRREVGVHLKARVGKKTRLRVYLETLAAVSRTMR